MHHQAAQHGILVHMGIVVHTSDEYNKMISTYGDKTELPGAIYLKLLACDPALKRRVTFILTVSSRKELSIITGFRSSKRLISLTYRHKGSPNGHEVARP
jgi:hypothetical protein